jgi:tetratricopeptide (TPR) repeat protein
MAVARDLKASEVLVFASEGERREVLAKALRKEDLKPHFTAGADEAIEILNTVRPASMLHDWPAIDATLAARFQQKLGKTAAYAGICRMLYVDALSPQMLALANDCGIRRVVSRVTTPAALVSTLRMAVSMLASMPDLQRIVLGEHDEDQLDEKIRAAYALFAHDPAIQLEFAKLCVRERSYKAAVEITNELLAADQHNVRALNLRARIFLLEGKVDDALALLDRGNVLSPFSTERLVMLGDAFFAKGKSAEAAKQYCEALKLDAGDKGAAQGLVKTSLSDGDVEVVFQMIRDSLSDEEAASLFNNAAVFAVRSQKAGDSFKLYDSALRVVRSERLRAAVHFNIALAHRRLGQEAEAHKHLRLCLRLDPQFVKAHKHLKGPQSA